MLQTSSSVLCTLTINVEYRTGCQRCDELWHIVRNKVAWRYIMSYQMVMSGKKALRVGIPLWTWNANEDTKVTLKGKGSKQVAAS